MNDEQAKMLRRMRMVTFPSLMYCQLSVSINLQKKTKKQQQQQQQQKKKTNRKKKLLTTLKFLHPIFIGPVTYYFF